MQNFPSRYHAWFLRYRNVTVFVTDEQRRGIRIQVVGYKNIYRYYLKRISCGGHHMVCSLDLDLRTPEWLRRKCFTSIFSVETLIWLLWRTPKCTSGFEGNVTLPYFLKEMLHFHIFLRQRRFLLLQH